MSDYTTAVKYAMFFFMVLMLIEWIASKISKKKVYQISDTISSISSGMTNNIKSILNLSVVIISYHWMFESFAIFKISSSWWVYVLGFLGIDFANYWTHRWNHEIRWSSLDVCTVVLAIFVAQRPFRTPNIQDVIPYQISVKHGHFDVD